MRPNIARIRDFWLEGSHNTPDDRKLAQAIELCAPHIPYLVRAQRSLIRRLVAYLVEQGITQFLDLGSGLPTNGHVHHVAQALNSATRVLYVDADPTLADDSRMLIDGNDNAAFLVADVREPRQIFDAPEFTRLIDLREPVAVLMIELLLHLPDEDDPAGVVAHYADVMAPGSHLALSHFCEDEQLLEGFQMFDRMMLGDRPVVNLRSPQALTGFFGDLELVDPGVVPVPMWRPESEEDADRNPEQVQMYVGVARKR
ncbi:SAM-dependent methyltransferase [Prauserella flavalba]|uniref:SAM-dependent methyltransferase n=1 Tax=Prauserella flavalba TaxID=1477506 RepID=UPI001FEC6747|nr:SAM-dependent methyltransferase [Prauserella flavalba]